ncbi:MAG: hypothetical protein QM786_02370 [Breznakibacter sp.]
MKNTCRLSAAFYAIIAALILASCSSPASNTATLTNFVKDEISCGSFKIDLNDPIASITEMAREQANQTILLKKDNVAQALREAQKYNHALIVVGKHTIVKITDFSDCKKSTSWAANMPYGVGYIKKGDLDKRSDYINQLIGMPDDQTRWLFLFN